MKKGLFKVKNWGIMLILVALMATGCNNFKTIEANIALSENEIEVGQNVTIQVTAESLLGFKEASIYVNDLVYKEIKFKPFQMKINAQLAYPATEAGTFRIKFEAANIISKATDEKILNVKPTTTTTVITTSSSTTSVITPITNTTTSTHGPTTSVPGPTTTVPGPTTSSTTSSTTTSVVGGTSFKVISYGGSSGGNRTEFYKDDALIYKTTGRGITIVVLNSATGAKEDARTFDTWASEINTNLMNQFIKGIANGKIILLGVSDEGRCKLNDEALDTLEQSLGSIRVRELNYRDSWAIVTLKGRNQSLAENVGTESKTAETGIKLPASLNDNPPRAHFSAPLAQRAGYVSMVVNFTDESIAGAGTIGSREWDFGDGNTSSELNPVHTYSNAGLFTVTLKVTTQFGTHTETRKSFVNAVNSITDRLRGLNFSPYVNGQDPNTGIILSRRQLEDMLVWVSPYTESIRLFDVQNGLANVLYRLVLIEESKTGNHFNKYFLEYGLLKRWLQRREYIENYIRVASMVSLSAKDLDMKVTLQAWLGSDTNANSTSIQALFQLISQLRNNGNIDAVQSIIVGSECIYRGDLNETQVIDYLNQVKVYVASDGIPVTYSDTGYVLSQHPSVIQACDFVCPTFYPYWEGKDINITIESFAGEFSSLKNAVGNKEIFLGETGWPSDGDTIGEAVPSLENACAYFVDFVAWAKSQDVGYFYFEAFDESWKAQYEGPQGAHWGIFYSNGELKPCMDGAFWDSAIPTTTTSQPTTTTSTTNSVDSSTSTTVPSSTTTITTTSIPSSTSTVTTTSIPTTTTTSVKPTTTSTSTSTTTSINGPPGIKITDAGHIGDTNAHAVGYVTNVNRNEYGVAVYILVRGYWWTKPYWMYPITDIDSDLTWICDIWTGGVDEEATKVRAYLWKLSDGDPPQADGKSTEIPIDSSIPHDEIDRT
ncbi:MAG: PKD domain-containing protein [Candidatus Moranbacteria bacterium]|nr:PKD domain-containing protein [Candidatus Moranbacteria bacterium]